MSGSGFKVVSEKHYCVEECFPFIGMYEYTATEYISALSVLDVGSLNLEQKIWLGFGYIHYSSIMKELCGWMQLINY